MVRDHARTRILQTPDATTIIGDRVFTRRGPFGGLSLDETPTAFTPDGDLQPSVVLVEEARVIAEPTRQGPPTALTAVHGLAAYVYQHDGYDLIDRVLAALKTALHMHRAGPTPTGVTWIESRWASDGPDLIDPSDTLRACLRVARYEITTLET